MPTISLDDDARARIGRRVDHLAQLGVSGTVLLAEAGEPVAQFSVGLADRALRTPVAADTRFQTASVTKMLTAAAVLDQVAQRRITVQTPVVDVVPADRRPRDLSADVTVHHLLSHTSGIADYCEEDDDLPNYCADYADLWRTVPPGHVERPVDILPLYGDVPAYCPPGEVTRYSNAGFVLLGEILEQLTGQTCTEVITDRVLRRAGMTDSAFDRSDEPRPRSALHYRPTGRINVHDVPVIGGGDGGCVCTAADLVRFCRALADGTLIGDLIGVATQPHGEMDEGWAFGYGLLLYPDRRRWGHGGGDPGVSAAVNHWPDRDVTVVCLCNVEEENDDLDPAFALRDAVLPETDLVSS